MFLLRKPLLTALTLIALAVFGLSFLWYSDEKPHFWKCYLWG